MKNTAIRVRFAPAPTGLMHLGNVRTALMNYLFARQHEGTFVLRIEDTDQQRNYDPAGKQILQDLAWLGLTHDEGPDKGGPYAPYIQSQRERIYQEKLQFLCDNQLAYRCFCTVEDLEKKRQRQMALKQPPRYDRACLILPVFDIEQKLMVGTPFIWRMKLDQTKQVTITDLAHGKITFNYKNFSDFPLTRTDGSVTFIFANFVDDMLMKISHIIRGEDHLTNTACQAALFQAFDTPLPIYWHMPILFNTQGKKLSKRDFGFSLQDLREAGYVPEALCNYLAIIGGGTFVNEVMALDDLIKVFNFTNMHGTGSVRYDVEKLTWLNHQWIMRLPASELTDRCLPFLTKVFPQAAHADRERLTTALQRIKTDLNTLADVTNVLHFYFVVPGITLQDIEQRISPSTAQALKKMLLANLDALHEQEQFLSTLKAAAKEQNIGVKELFTCLRLMVTGEAEGPSIQDLFEILGSNEIEKRINKVLR